MSPIKRINSFLENIFRSASVADINTTVLYLADKCSSPQFIVGLCNINYGLCYK